jgi:hypothetical protein
MPFICPAATTMLIWLLRVLQYMVPRKQKYFQLLHSTHLPFSKQVQNDEMLSQETLCCSCLSRYVILVGRLKQMLQRQFIPNWDR